MEDAAIANSGCSPPESSNETTGTTGDNLANPEISSPTASKIKDGVDDLPKTHEPQPQDRKIEGWRHPEPLDPVRTKWNALIFLSHLVVIFTLAKVWLYRDRPLPIAVVWEISLSISLLCFSWVSFLKVTTSTLFLYLSHGVLLAVIAHLALSPKVGMLAVHVNSHVAIGFLGYALAERRLHEATERFDIPMPTNKQQADRLRGLRIIVGLFCSLITVGAAVYVAWLVRHDDEYTTSELLLSILVLFPSILALWISFVAAMLRGALMGQDALGFVASYFGLVAAVLVLSVAAMGFAAAAINVWMTVIGLSGFFGYSLSVYDSYKGILGMIRDDKESAESENLLQPTTDKSDGSSDGSSHDGTSAESENLLQPTTDKSDGSSNDGTA